MKGLELSKKYYEEYGKPMLEDLFADILPLLAVGLVGSGSECYGFDDETSTDHDFEPGFCIFIPNEDILDRKTAFNLERAYSKLPKEFSGYKRSIVNPVGGNRHGVILISDFYKNKVGTNFNNLTEDDWFSLPEYSLFEAVNGEVFFDNYGEFSKIRKNLLNMPPDIKLKKLAGNLLIMAQSGQYNFNRCLNHNETAAAQLALFDFVKSGMQVVFLINNRYMPYYKWSFRALKQLPILSNLYDSFEYLITSDNENFVLKNQVIEDISAMISKQLVNDKMLKSEDIELERVAYEVNSKIENTNIRNLNILYGI